MTDQFPPLTPDQALTEARALRRIAILLGMDEWDTGDLDMIAMFITRAGLPNPGIPGTVAFYTEAEKCELPAPVPDPLRTRLEQLATALEETPFDLTNHGNAARAIRKALEQ